MLSATKEQGISKWPRQCALTRPFIKVKRSHGHGVAHFVFPTLLYMHGQVLRMNVNDDIGVELLQSLTGHVRLGLANVLVVV